MIIAIFLMAEAWILNLSYAFVDEQSVINYVSFASTITSLILAVLAIIYGFYQSENGKKSNAALEGNIDSLKATQNKLDFFVSSVDEQLKSINDSALNLKEIGFTFSSSISKIDELKNDISDINNNQKISHDNIWDIKSQLKSMGEHKNSVDSEDFVKKVFDEDAYLLGLFGVLLVAANKKAYKGNVLELIKKNFAGTIFDFLNDPENQDKLGGKDGILKSLKSFSLDALVRYSIDVLHISNIFDILDFDEDGNNISFNKEQIDKLNEKYELVKSGRNKYLAEAIIKSFEN